MPGRATAARFQEPANKTYGRRSGRRTYKNARRTLVSEEVRRVQLHEMPTAPYSKVTHSLAGSA